MATYMGFALWWRFNLKVAALLSLAFAGALLSSVAFAASDSRPDAYGKVQKQYVDTRFGQAHLYQITPAPGDVTQTPLVAFHSTAMSGDYWREFMTEMGMDRVVIAPDTPGYGLSDRPPTLQPLGEIAAAAADVLDALGYGKNGDGLVDVMGYHTGTYIATELAIIRPDLVRRVVVPGIPFFVGEERQKALESNSKPRPYKEDGSYVAGLWERRIKNNADTGIPTERQSTLFASYLLAGSDGWWAYHSVFTYPAEERLPLVKQPVFNPHVGDGLRERTAAAAQLFPDVEMLDMPGLNKAIFHKDVDLMAEVIRAFLDK